MLPLCLIVGSDTVDPAGLHRGFDGYGRPTRSTPSARPWHDPAVAFDAVIVDGDGHADSLLHLCRSCATARTRRSSSSGATAASAGRSRRSGRRHRGHRQAGVAAPDRRQAAPPDRDRRTGRPSVPKPVAAVQLGPLRLDPRRAAASAGDAPLVLTTGEFELLLLASRPGEFASRDDRADPRQPGRGRRVPAQRRHAHLSDPQEAARRRRVLTTGRDGVWPGLLPEAGARRGAGEGRRALSAVVGLRRQPVRARGQRQGSGTGISGLALETAPNCPLPRGRRLAGRRTRRRFRLHQARGSVGHWLASVAAPGNLTLAAASWRPEQGKLLRHESLPRQHERTLRTQRRQRRDRAAKALPQQGGSAATGRRGRGK